MEKLTRWTACSMVALAIAGPAAGQEQDVTRRSFAFFNRSLTVEVVSEASGVLQVVRGGRDRVSVAVRAAPGLAVVALGGWNNDRLRLAAVGDERVEYIVVVPQDLQLHVTLPHRDYPVLAESAPAVEYRWERTAPGGAGARDSGRAASGRLLSGAESQPRRADGAAEAGTRHGTGTGIGAYLVSNSEYFLAYADAVAPDEVSVTDLTSVRRLGVRTGSDNFRIEASRRMALTPGRKSKIEIRPAGEPIDLILYIPASANEFTLRAGQNAAVTIRDGQVKVSCSPMTSVLKDGRRFIDITPAHGVLDCEGQVQHKVAIAN
jgi:hypothetical protein